MKREHQHKQRNKDSDKSEVKFLRTVDGFSKEDRTWNVLSVKPLEEEVHRYNPNWESHLARMDVKCIPTLLLRHKPERHLSVERPLKIPR